MSSDTVDCLRELLAQAERGEIIGIAFAAMLQRRGYIVKAAGEAHINPTFSRGMVQALDDYLGRRVNAGNAAQSTGY